MKTLVFGRLGQLGVALADSVPADVELAGFDLPELDITDATAVRAVCREEAPSLIVNAAAYTAVDKAETEPELAMAINCAGPANIAAAARDVGARFVHISTDFVFDGSVERPYRPDSDTNPISVYGQTKRAGELAVLERLPETAVILRTAWLYSSTGNNFVKTMLRMMDERDEIRVVADQRGTPTWAQSLATAVWGVAGRPGVSGMHHWTDDGNATWHEFALAVQEEALDLGLLRRRIPIWAIATSEYPTQARRPMYSVLDCTVTRAQLGLHVRNWRVNLRLMLQGMID